ncbi:MAG: type VI secretion system-associated FHA domain protein TagH, partial [Gammaproteobacteria bacterium]
MALRLRVVSEHAIRLGERSTKVFGVHGGTIGRSTNNDWILPDPERYLSGKHARVDFRAGTYVLVDTSSNGTYVNGAQVPLGKYHDYELKEGDYVRLGEYELLVSIDKSNDFPTEESAIVAYDGQSPSSAVKKSTANDLGADLDLSQLLEPSDVSTTDSAVRPRDAYGQSLPYGQPAHAGPPEPAFQSAAELEEQASGTPWHMMTRPLKIASRKADAVNAEDAVPAAPHPQSPVLYDGDFDAGMNAFCRGAGIDARNITPEARATALQLAGQLLRESVLGLMDLNQGRNEFRNRFRISAPANDGPESPLNFSRGVDEALV